MGFLFGHGGGYKKAIKQWDQWEQAAKAEYENQANQGIQNSAYQQALAAEREMLKDNLAASNAMGAVTGASPAAQALAKQQAVDAIADATAKMGANITADRNAAMTNYINAGKQATEAKSQALIAESQAQSQALSGLISAGAQLASSFAPVPKK